MASAPFGFSDLAGATLRRSVIDPVTGAPVVTSAPTGEVVQRAGLLPIGRDDSGGLVPAVPQGLFDAIDAARFPGEVYRGEKSILDPQSGRISDGAIGKAFEIAGSAMAGSSAFGAPKGALRSFGGAAAKDDPLAAFEAGLAKSQADLPKAPSLSPEPLRLDPTAKSWDLYHGSNAGPDFERFDPHRSAHSESGALFLAPRAETANAYTTTGRSEPGAAGSRVFRTTVEPGKTGVFDLYDLVANDPTFAARTSRVVAKEFEDRGLPAKQASRDADLEAYRLSFLGERARDAEINAQLGEMGFAPSMRTGVSNAHGYIGAAIDMAREQGLDTAIIRGLAEHGGDDQVVALTPGRVRSHYAPDQLLYSGGPDGAAAAGALAASNQAQAAPGATSMSAGIPFGFGDVAAAIDPRRRQPIPFGNPDVVLPSELPGVEIPTREAQAPPVQAPAAPAGIATSFLGAPDIAWPGAQAPVAPAPAPEPEATASVSPKPVRLPTITAPAPTSVSPAPTGTSPLPVTPPASPTVAPASTAAASEDDGSGPSFANFRKNGGMDLLGSIGIGLLGSPTMAGGLSTGLQLAQRNESQRTAGELAKTELALKRRKLLQEEAGNNATIAALVGKGVPLADAQAAIAASVAGNREALSNLLNNKFRKEPDAPAGYRLNKDGSASFIRGGPQDPAMREAEAAAAARGTSAGKGPEDYTLGENQTRVDGTTNKVIASGTPKRPDAFELEGKLRGEFGKGLGTFQDVHDGYGRVIASVEQRAADPKGVSPASDMSLVFGFMKMLDPGSVVREGEYATAKNATGIPDQVRNAYNKAIDGEFLTPGQRQDFVGTAGRLYGKARTSAETIQGRYRNLAGEYGVDPDRSAYLPPVLVAPKVDPSRAQDTVPPPVSKPSRLDLEAEARRRGLMR